MFFILSCFISSPPPPPSHLLPLLSLPPPSTPLSPPFHPHPPPLPQVLTIFHNEELIMQYCKVPKIVGNLVCGLNAISSRPVCKSCCICDTKFVDIHKFISPNCTMHSFDTHSTCF